MRDTGEIHESPEKDVIKTPEEKIETFDDLRAPKPDRIDTFDDIRKQGSDGSIKTFDDIRGNRYGADKPTTPEAAENPTKENPAAMEQKRLSQAVEHIKRIDSMKPEKWKTLGPHEKEWGLRHSGEALRDAFHTPDPSLTTSEMRERGLLGEYEDGYAYDRQSDKYNGNIDVNPLDFEGHGIVGSDYGIRMNKEGFDYEKNKKIFGDDPREAIDTYGHEFRHSYQNEQVHAYEQGFRVDDPVKASEWSINLKPENYKQPPKDELAKTEPERYFKEYEAYRNQPVERDAREFGEKLSNRLYGEVEKR